jgi:pSer/pThr/pTyr-binding forkhead associated (FHA) protein
MDDPRADAEAPCLPVDFVPLRLVLQTTGSVIELTRPDMVLGRHSEADVRLPLPDVSRRHCRFHFREGSWHIHDLRSLNGTFVNNLPIENSLVRPGDTLRVGGFTFTIDLPSQPAPKDEMILSMTRILPTLHPDSEQSRRAS